MKICIVSHSYPRFVGDYRSNFIESLAHAYARAGARVTVFTPYTPLFNRSTAEIDGVRIVTYRYAPFAAWHTIGYGHSMIGDLSMHPVDLVLAPFLLLFGTLRLTSLLRRERFDLLHAHWAVPNTLIALWARTLTGARAKVFTSFPGSDVAAITRLGWLGKQLIKIIGRSDYLSCDGSDLGEDVIHAGLDPRRIDYVIYGVNEKEVYFSQEAREQLRRQLAIDDDEIVLLMIGRFVAKKGFSTGFEALKHILRERPRVTMIVVGDGPLQPE
jgi:glycosyltransferase involved in cell wall biosynthesis